MDNQTVNKENSQVIACLMAGLGGSLPTLCKLAAASTNSENVIILSPGHLSAMGLYFLIALILCAGLAEKRRKEAFILGIAAPAIIASILSGASYSDADQIKVSAISIISSAYAQDSLNRIGANEENEIEFWIDFKRGMGFPVAAEIAHRKLKIAHKNLNIKVDQVNLLQSEIKMLEQHAEESIVQNKPNCNIKKTTNSLPDLLQCKECPPCSPSVEIQTKYIEHTPVNYNISINDPNWKLLVAADAAYLYEIMKLLGYKHDALRSLINSLLRDGKGQTVNNTDYFWGITLDAVKDYVYTYRQILGIQAGSSCKILYNKINSMNTLIKISENLGLEAGIKPIHLINLNKMYQLIPDNCGNASLEVYKSVANTYIQIYE